MTNILMIIIGLLGGLIALLFKFNGRLKEDLTQVKQERDDLALGFKRMKQNVEKYQVVQKDAFSRDINDILNIMRKRGQVREP